MKRVASPEPDCQGGKRPSVAPATCRDKDAFKGSIHLWLVRHGETENNVLLAKMKEELKELPHAEFTRRYHSVRSSDPVLSALGHEQVDRLPDHPALRSLLNSGRPVDLYTSPLRRAIETAASLHEAFPSRPPIRLRPDLAEIGGIHGSSDEGHGSLPGLASADLVAAFPNLTLDVSDLPLSGGWWHGNPCEDTTVAGGCNPSWKRVERIGAWLRQLRPTTEGVSKDARDIIVVGHGQMFDFMLTELLGLPRGMLLVKHSNTAVTHLELRNSFTYMHCVNASPAAPTSSDNTATQAT